MLTCESCQHYKDGACEFEIQLYECEDAYDCTKYEDKGEMVVLPRMSTKRITTLYKATQYNTFAKGGVKNADKPAELPTEGD